MGRYDDIIHLSRPVSATRLPMSRENRAAQFAPFAALTGYDAAVRETARLTEECPEPDESRKAVLDRQLRLLASAHAPEVRVVWFCPDERKAGGAFRSFSGQLKKLDPYAGTLVFTDGTVIPVERIRQLESDCFPFLEEE